MDRAVIRCDAEDCQRDCEQIDTEENCRENRLIMHERNAEPDSLTRCLNRTDEYGSLKKIEID